MTGLVCDCLALNTAALGGQPGAMMPTALHATWSIFPLEVL